MEPNEIASRLAGLSAAKRALLERRMRGEAQGTKVSGIGRRAGTGPAPLSFSQQRLWFLDQLEPGSPTYNLRVLLRLSGPLHREALGRSFQEVARRHEVLRTAFQVADGIPVQAVLPWLEVALPWIDLTALPERVREEESLRQALALADRSFDLSAPPLVRLALLDLGAGAHHLLVVMHHIVSDGWSTGVLVREVGALYNAFLVDGPSPLPELPIQYGDFAVWQRGWLSGGVKEQHLGYWRERLAGAPAGLDLPTDRPRPAVQSFRGATHRFGIGAGLTEALAALARGEGMTPFMVLAAGLFSLLSRLSGEDDLALGTPIANRNRPEVEGLIGFFVNTLVLRASAGPRDVLGLLHHVREVTLGAYAHQDLPFEELVAEIHPDRDLSRTPLFQVALAYENAPPLGSSLAGVELSPVELPVGSAKFDLAFILRGDGETLAGTLEYATDLYDGATAARLCDHWLRLLQTAVADPGLELAGIELLSPAERHQVLREWNDTLAAKEGEALLHQLFEARVDLQPEARAAVWEGESLTYEQLEERSNRLANLLQGLGAGPGSPVAVWMERSLDMLTALLGASKAGAAYLPIDAGWPADRAEAVLAGTEAAFVLTRRAHLPAVQELQWRLPRLADAVCLDVDTPQPPPEPLDVEAVRGLFDVVAERATDWVTAGGFISSYTGEPFAEADVLEYRDRVLGLTEPWIGAAGDDGRGKRVLEIGSGSGLILWELAPRVGHYVGVDPSERTQRSNRERAAREGHGNVELPTGFAHEIENLAETPPGSFDLVILASTVQFFPGLAYLEHVLELALSRLAPGGALVIADVMDPRRREDFRRSLAAYAAALGRGGDRTGEGRLYVDEGFFADLFPGAAAVLHRETGFANELGFRYDVVIRKDGASSPAPQAADPSHRGKRVWTGWHVAGAAAARPLATAAPADIAYVIHTSGSTGAPKGIVVQHRPAVELCRWINSTFGVGPDDRLLFITSPAFDLSVYDVFGVLAAGGTVHVASEAALRDPEELVRLLTEEPVTIWDSAPAALQQLAPLLPEGPESHEARLRLVLLSGDWIPVPLPDLVRAAFPGARVISLGGATEATVWSNWYPIGEVDPRWPSIPYGRPITNARYHVLDRALRPCALGVPGDLYIGGACLCVGYARLPEMTAERFIPDPFAGEPGARLYGTGDRARYGRDGNLEFLGRVDQQVKVRGYRIELEEIEAVLARHPGVREAAVVAREDIPGDKRLVGYVVPLAQPAPSAAELRASLQQVMPDYMVPWTFVALERMPITANGKLDRKALPAPQEVAAAVSAYVAPRTDLERAVAGVWQEVLRQPRVGLNDDFFELGGSSLLATQVISRVRQACGVELPLRALFEARTLAEMAQRVEALQGGPALLKTGETGATAATASSPLPPLTAVPRTGPLPLSFSQQRLWFLDQLVPGSPLYNIPGALRLIGRLDAALLGRVLGEVVRRHEVLRTTFRSEGGEPVQVIAAEPRLPLPLVDLAGLPTAHREAELARRTAAEARLPFDLAAGPLLRSTLLRLSPAEALAEHVVLITLHHIVADAWSMEVFSREIGALYGAWSLGLPSPLPELPLQYADHAVWQRRRLAGEVLERELEYWRQQLAGAPRVLELPADRPRPAVQSFQGRSRPLVLPASLAAPFASRGQRRGATLFMALLGAFATVLGRHAGREDVVVGSPVAGRDRPEIEGLIGFFINTLVLRVDLSGDPGFDGLLDRVRAMALDAFAHQSLPFERLVDELAPVRDPSHSPLFQVAFAFQSAPLEPLRLPGLTLEPLHDDSGTAKVDLLLSVTETGGAISGIWEYSTDLFDEVTIDRWSGHLASVLEAVATEEDRPLSALPLLVPAERHQLLTEWNDTRDPEDGDATLDRLFAGTAGEWPDRVAVSFEDHSVTYRELAARAGRLARTLRAMGVEPEALVGICAEEGIERVVGVVGTVLAGGAFLPLDPAHPPERLELMADDARIRVLLTQEHLRDALPTTAAVVCLDDYVRTRQEPVPLGSLPGPWGPVPDNLSYVIYTSGSTGRPNGVQVCHRSAVHLLRLAARHTLADRHSRVLQLVSFSFDASVLETWLAFSTGAALCVVGQETRLSGPALAETIRREGITTMALPPPILATIPHEDLPSLRTILVGGDRCSADLANRWAPPGGSLRLLNCYGPTETTIYSGFQRCAGPYRRDPSIGRPIANLRMVVLDPRGHLAPVGVPGELCVGGAGAVRGYLHRPDLTARRFVPDPFAGDRGEPGGRLYRSGDLVRLLPNGEIEFLGRIDRQVKLRGLRIELGEIETLLAEHPAVRECTVVVREDAPGERALVAYLVPRQEPAPETSGLRGFLAAKLPSYMVPTAFVTLAALPLSPTGKVDHAALPVPSKERSGRDTVAARTQAEAALARIWSQVLGVETVGVHDNFFDLGGDSILCIQVVSRAQQEGLWLTARDLFRHQTVAELAVIAATAAEAPGVSVTEEAGAEVPLTPVQRLFFGLDLADPHHFNQALLLALQQEAEPGRLERALGAVAALHAALRYRYLRDGEGTWRQVVTDAPAPLARLDLSALPRPRRRAALEAAAAQLQPSLDLTRGPLLRAALFALGEEGQRLLLVLHHLIVDGVSWRILLGDLETAYRSLATGGAGGVELPPVATPFARWSAKLGEHAGSAAVTEELSYWLAPARAAVRPLPVDSAGDLPGGDTLAAARAIIAELDPEATRALLQDVPKAYHTQINDVLLTALAEAFAGWTGQTSLLVDLEGHGREELFEGFDTSRTVGWFTSLFPVLLQLPDSDSAAANPGDSLKAIKEQLRAVPRGGIGYGLLRHAGDGAAAARLREMPPAEVVFNYLGQLDRGLAGSALFAPASESSGPALSPRQKRGHLLEINGGIVAGATDDAASGGSRLRLTWTYGARHESRTIQALADRFIGSLRLLIDHCRAKEAGDFTPSDFPEARFSQKDLDTLMARIGKRSPGAGARRTGPR